MIDHHRRLFRYDDWANREVVASLEASANPPEKAVRLLAHIVGTEWTWLARIRGTASRLAVWPDLTVADASGEIDRLRGAWKEFFSVLADEKLRDGVTYTNTKGERFTSRIEDILTHVAMHGGYHRGQIATVMREQDLAPAYTDFIQASRTGVV